MLWILAKPLPDVTALLERELMIPRLVADLLAQRGITTAEAAERFLHPKLEHLHPPDLMLGMADAVSRIERAIAAREKIFIYGDYDVDGTIAVVLLKTCIDTLGGQCDYHVPHRILEGYGMRDEVIERAAADGVTLVISVDTGIRAFAAAETAARLGIDLIVTDHHLPETSEEPDVVSVPKALAVLNPNQQNCSYPCKGLCGAGVVFKLCSALLTRAGREKQIPSYIKMAAIATIADSVPLIGENRVIVSLGLDGLRRPVNGGLKALLEVAQLTSPGHVLDSHDIAFRIAPRINAGGRMDVAHEVVELFLSPDEKRRNEIAAKLDRQNTERQGEEQRIMRTLYKRLEEDESLNDTYCLVLEGESWHRGVIGICASRIVERTGKPTLVFSCDPESGEAHGSGRSIASFHLLNALESAEVKPLFTRFGGHAAAVGCSLANEKIPALRSAIDRYAHEHLTAEDFVPSLYIDAEISLSDVTPSLLNQLSQLEPYGMGNRGPVFAARGLRMAAPPRFLKEKHIKLRLQQAGFGRSAAIDALGWNWSDRFRDLAIDGTHTVNAAFTIELNTHPDFGGLQLILKDLTR